MIEFTELQSWLIAWSVTILACGVILLVAAMVGHLVLEVIESIKTKIRGYRVK